MKQYIRKWIAVFAAAVLWAGLWQPVCATVEHGTTDYRDMTYERYEPEDFYAVQRTIEPVGLMFSEYYFYLTAFLENKSTFENPDDLFPTIYRIDRIKSFQVLDEHFRIPYHDRFEEGEFRKRVQFMYGGKLQRVKFRYTGQSLEAVLDRLPTAEIISHDDTGWIITAEVFGKGIDMWLQSQGALVELMEGVSK